MWFAELDLWILSNHSFISAIPSGWQLLKIGDVVQQIYDRIKIVNTHNYNMYGVKWYGEGIFKRESVLGKEMSANYVYPLVSGALIYNRLFAWKGSFSVVPENVKGYVSNEFPQFRVIQEKIHTEYLYLYCLTCKVLNIINKASAGSAAVSRNRLKESDFLQIELLLPDLETQNKIITHYNDLTYKGKMALLKADEIEKEAIEQFRTDLGVIQSQGKCSRRAFSLMWGELDRWGVDICRNSKEDNVRYQYSVTSMGSICRLGSGGTPSRKISNYYDKNGIAWVKTTEVRNGIILDTEEKISPLGLENSSAKIYPIGSIIVAMYGQGVTRGRTAKLGIEAATNQACCVLYDFNPEVGNDYVWCYLMSEYDRLRALASGNNQPNLNAEMIANYPIPVPSLEIQRELAKNMIDARHRAALERQKAEAIKTRSTAELEALILGHPFKKTS